MNPGSRATLVTGAAGFAGGHLVELLSGRSDLVGWSRSAPSEPLSALATWRRIDLLDRDRVRSAIAELRPSEVYHCAGAPHVAHSWSNATESLSSNVLATHYLLDAVRRADIPCRVLIPGSAMVYAPSTTPITEDSRIAPDSPYALSKLAQEQLGLRAVSEDGVTVIVTRSFNHTGPRQSPDFAAPAMARQIALIERGRLEPLIKVGNLEAHRDLTDVRDTVRAYALLMEHGMGGVVYNIATGIGRPIRALLEALVARSHVAVRIHTDESLLRPLDRPFLIGDASRLRALTGWVPAIDYERMLDDLMKYWRETVEHSSES